VNRRRSAVLATTFALAAVSSCATFNRNDVAAEVDGRSLSAEAAQALVAGTDQPTNGDQLRGKLTAWILLELLGDQAKQQYQAGFDGSPVVCLAAIPVPSADAANEVLTALAAGAPFADAASQFSTEADLAQTGGIVRVDGNECSDPSSFNAGVAAALTGVPVGQPVAADLDTISAVLLLRPFDELQLETQSLVAGASVSQDQLATILDTAKIYVDPRYGRWDQDSDSVVPLSS
jgi:hypothetical protein